MTQTIRLLLSVRFIACIFLFCPVTKLPAATVPQPDSAASPRTEKIINSQWTFNYFPQEVLDTAYKDPGFDDTAWPAIALPHTWSTYETTGELHPFIRNASEKDDPYWWHGWGWYRKKFVIDTALSGKKIFVELDGVMKNCQVWLNGKPLGGHIGGYTSFYFDITAHVVFTGENVLAIAVSNRRADQYRTPPMTAGNFNVYGGIYRDVKLVVKDNLYIPFQGSSQHEGGTFVTTPQVNPQKATVRVRTWVKNDYTKPQVCKLVTTVKDANGKVVATLENTATVQPGTLYEFDQTGKPVASPKLWSVEEPNLYTVYSEIYSDGKKRDVYKSPLGFRYFSWNYEEKRLYLNGKQIHIHGTNRHQEYPWLGDAIPKWMHEKDLQDIRFNLHHNFIRTAHYTQDKYVYYLCDRYGIIVCEEVPNIKSIDFSEEIQEQHVREMVRRDRNHPSILFWSVGNETNDAADSRWIYEEDTTRIIHARHVKGSSAGEFARHTHGQMDMENLLRCTVRGWYNEDVKNLAPADNQDAGHEEHQHRMARIEGASQRGRLDMGNGVMWIYADHGADREYTGNPLKHLNPKGWVDAYRVPKYLYYLWQANYAAKPMIFIHPHFWRSRYVGQQKDIVVDSNCDYVELKVNGNSIGIRYPRPENFFTVTFEKVPVGKGIITAEGKKNGKPVSARIEMAAEPARILLTASHQTIQAGLASVSIITAGIVDARGVHVYGATNPLTWEVSGPATLAGPVQYTSDTDKQEEMEGTMYIDTPVSNLVRSNGKPGIITVQVKSGQLIAGHIQIRAEAGQEVVAVGITEPALPESNRARVARNQQAAANAATARIPAPEMKESDTDIFVQEKDRHTIAARVKNLLRQQNPELDTSSIEYPIVVNSFTEHLLQNNGELVADDYNFTAARYNTSRQLTGFIDSTALPAAFKKELKTYYADNIINRGIEVNFRQEKDKLSHIPVSGKLVTGNKQLSAAYEKPVLARSSDLRKVTGQLYPAFRKLDADIKEKILAYVQTINPYLRKSIHAGKHTGPATEYSLEKDRLYFIPEPDAVKALLSQKNINR